MTTLPRILVSAALALGLIGLVAFGMDSCHRGHGEQSQTTSSIEVGKADTHEEQARAKDAEIQDLKAKREADEAALDRSKAEAQALRRKLASQQRPSDPPVQPAGDPGGEAVGDGRDELVQRLDAVIQAQDAVIVGLKQENAALKVRGDEALAAFEHERKARLAQEAGTKAWKDAVTTSRWLGRVEGFAAGAALGYLGGRR